MWMGMEKKVKEYHSFDEMVKEIYGEKAFITENERVHGGDINDAYRMVLSTGDSIFVKINSRSNLQFFRTESNGLSALQSVDKIGVPKILGMGIDRQKDCSFLALEYLESARRIDSYWETFGHQLAGMHRAECLPLVSSGNDGEKSRLRFGFYEDNFIGASPQKNQPKETWIGFYRDCRLLPQLTMAERYLGTAVRKKAEWLLEHLGSYLREPDFPSLLHGDLWGGNMLCGPDGRAWVIDPAVYAGDFEADLAMTQLFGSLPARFYEAYSERNPIDRKGYAERKGLYDLYHLLNHLNLFGRGYLGGVVEIINRYAGR